MRPLFISIPAWSVNYVDLAVRFTLPAALVSLRAANWDGPVTFLICTDRPQSFGQVLQGRQVEFSAPRFMPGDREPQWDAFKRAHRDAVARTPDGAALALLNSDIVVSLETFAVVSRIFADSAKAVVSVGIRTLIDGVAAPIGADAEQLSRWIWSHRHSITDECIWGSGRTRHPTILFFPHADGAVSMHGFHLTPMFIVKDRRSLQFVGTIDDDMLENYVPGDLFFAENREFAVAELSPLNKHHPFREPLTVEGVLQFWRHRASPRPSHLRNFARRFRVLGNPRANHPAADAILAGLNR